VRRSRSWRSKRILHRQPALEHLPVLHILRVQRVATGDERRRDNDRIPMSDLVAFAQRHGLLCDLRCDRDDIAALHQGASQRPEALESQSGDSYQIVCFILLNQTNQRRLEEVGTSVSGRS